MSAVVIAQSKNYWAISTQVIKASNTTMQAPSTMQVPVKKVQARSKPSTYEPPFPAYSMDRNDQKTYATSLIGVQHSADDDASTWIT
jgi:hypothetical protein